jgi:prevent-host-death family protein
MVTVTAVQAKTRFGELLDRVARGEEIVITRHEKAVARLVPEGGANLEHIRASFCRPKSFTLSHWLDSSTTGFWN